MKILPCPFCGGAVMQVVKLIGRPSIKSQAADYSAFEEFEEYVCCEDCDDLEEVGVFINDFIED